MIDVRWQQRFQNFSRAFILLRSALENQPLAQLSDLEQEGVIQRFEYSYELAWKTMKDYMEDNGIIITPVTPRNVIKEAFAAGMIDNGQVWIDMMLHQNLLAHTYDFSKFKEVLDAIESHYLTALNTLYEWFINRQLES
jgi:nucleotidyltransferase substrate binding protein (TIGR01987 family)